MISKLPSSSNFCAVSTIRQHGFFLVHSRCGVSVGARIQQRYYAKQKSGGSKQLLRSATNESSTSALSSKSTGSSARLEDSRAASFTPNIAVAQANQLGDSTPSSPSSSSPSLYNVQSAFELITSNRPPDDTINPPGSTLPPPLEFQARGSENAAVYWYRVGKTYATFYKDGMKAVWYNWKATKALRERLFAKETSTAAKEIKGASKKGGAKHVPDAVAKGLLSRSEFQLLVRSRHDIGKLPLFALMAVLFGEWLVLLVPFIPSTVPFTARIPKQVRQMRLKAEERRRISFRQGVKEPSAEQISTSEGTDESQAQRAPSARENRTVVVRKLQPDQLFHISSSLGLHNRLWDRVQLAPPTSLLRRAVEARLQYLSLDDALLTRGNDDPARLTPVELYIACEERGIDVLGKNDETLRRDLSWWLDRRPRDSAQAFMPKLFRRPGN